MNKTLTSLIFSTIAIAGCNSVPTQTQLTKTIQPNPYRWELRKQTPPKTIEGIQQIQKNDIIYASEQGEIWMSPKMALTLGYGDCDEKAITGAYFAGLIGYPRKIIGVAEALSFSREKKHPRGHVLTFLEEETNGKKKYGLVDENLRFQPTYESVEGLLKDVNQLRRKQGAKWDYNYYKIIDLDQEYGESWVTTTKNLWKEDIQFGNYKTVN
jgi:hypothetical protein